MNSFNFKLEQYKILVKFRLNLNKIRNRLIIASGVLIIPLLPQKNSPWFSDRRALPCNTRTTTVERKKSLSGSFLHSLHRSLKVSMPVQSRKRSSRFQLWSLLCRKVFCCSFYSTVIVFKDQTILKNGLWNVISVLVLNSLPGRTI